MAQEFHILKVLQWTAKPAFWATEGIIRQVNSVASGCLLREGMAVTDLLKTGQEEYKEMNEGSLFLSLRIGEQEWAASIHRVKEGDLVLLESTVAPELQAMALAAMKLRQPLAALMSELDQLLPELSDVNQVGRINRRIHQLLRLVGNMSAGAGGDSGNMELRELCGMLDEIFEKTASLAEKGNIALDWSVPNSRVYTVVDAQKLERAVYNMLSNALKATPSGGRIYAKVHQRGKLLLISITDSGNGIAQEVRNFVYTRYLRTPGLEPEDQGIGLGMGLIASAARLHGGTVLLETLRDGGTRVTMTLTIHQNQGSLRSRSLPVDYAGEQDHALVELSDVLPSSVYEY